MQRARAPAGGRPVGIATPRTAGGPAASLTGAAEAVVLLTLQLAASAAAVHCIASRRVTAFAAVVGLLAALLLVGQATMAHAHARLVRVDGSGLSGVGASAGEDDGGAGQQGVRVGFAGSGGRGSDLSFAFQVRA